MITPSAAPKLIGALMTLLCVVLRIAPLVMVSVPAPESVLGDPVLLLLPLPMSSALIVLAALIASLLEISTSSVAAAAEIDVVYSAPVWFGPLPRLRGRTPLAL